MFWWGMFELGEVCLAGFEEEQESEGEFRF